MLLLLLLLSAAAGVTSAMLPRGHSSAYGTQRSSSTVMMRGPFRRQPPREVMERMVPGWRKEYVGTQQEIAEMWLAFEEVYGGRERALMAWRKNGLVLKPTINSPQTIRGAHRALVELFGKAGAAEIIDMHPGVLACDPVSLAQTDKQEIKRTAQMVASVDSLPEEVKAAIPTVTLFLLVGIVGTRVVQCGNGMCDDATSWLPDGGLGPALVRFISDQWSTTAR
eukprot:scaffold240986_cov32-Tisochrysis_lutea.AAC.3